LCSTSNEGYNWSGHGSWCPPGGRRISSTPRAAAGFRVIRAKPIEACETTQARAGSIAGFAYREVAWADPTRRGRWVGNIGVQRSARREVPWPLVPRGVRFLCPSRS
jgi:hypothetical protein